MVWEDGGREAPSYPIGGLAGPARGGPSTNIYGQLWGNRVYVYLPLTLRNK